MQFGKHQLYSELESSCLNQHFQQMKAVLSKHFRYAFNLLKSIYEVQPSNFKARITQLKYLLQSLVSNKRKSAFSALTRKLEEQSYDKKRACIMLISILNRVVVPVEMRSFNKLMQFYSKREILSKDKTLFLFVSLSNLDKIVHSIKIEAFAAVKAQSRHQQLVINKAKVITILQCIKQLERNHLRSAFNQLHLNIHSPQYSFVSEEDQSGSDDNEDQVMAECYKSMAFTLGKLGSVNAKEDSLTELRRMIGSDVAGRVLSLAVGRVLGSVWLSLLGDGAGREQTIHILRRQIVNFILFQGHFIERIPIYLIDRRYFEISIIGKLIDERYEMLCFTNTTYIFKVDLMIKQFATLSLVLLLGLVAWSAYERTTWDEDYTKYPLAIIQFSKLNTTFEQHINPAYFKNATVITNDTHLRYPQDIAVTSEGTIYAGLCDGSIVAVTPGSNNTQLIYKGNQTGRVYGLIITEDDSTLYYLTEFKGVVRYDLNKREATYLLTDFQVKQTGALNSICIDEQRQILYITDSGPIRMAFSAKEVILGHAAGKIYSIYLSTGKAAIMLDGLAFPNGIVFEKATNSIIFSELTRFQIIKYHLNSGQRKVLIKNLFGFADNLKLNSQGELLVGIPTTRSALTQQLLKYPFAKKLALYLPERLSYALNPKRAGGIKIDTKTGEIIEYMFGAPTKISFVTTIIEKNGKTYFSSLRSPTILVLDSTAALQSEVKKEKQIEL